MTPCALQETALAKALRISKKYGHRRFFLAVFSWCGKLSRWFESHQTGAVQIDIRLGPHGNVLSPPVESRIRGWVKFGVVSAAWVATPCAFWFRARHDFPDGGGPRSKEHIWGKRWLSVADAMCVEQGAITARFSARLIELCCRTNTPCVLENLASSLLWVCPAISRLLRRGLSTKGDFCQYGSPRLEKDFVWVPEHPRSCRACPALPWQEWHL